jgi:undecaprenyl phosphate-alpha-L-ara4FN deformylase
MKRIALKIDVDTCRGTLFGVPTLIELLQRHEASGTFFFSLGPDHSGREARHLSPSRYYDLLTRLYGLLLPAPDIGIRGAVLYARRRAMPVSRSASMPGTVCAGKICPLTADNAWIAAEMEQAYRRFAAVFGERH